MRGDVKPGDVGFGEQSKRSCTRVMNAFVTVETQPVAGGADVRVSARRDHIIVPEVDVDTGEVVIHVRKDAGPRIGQTVTVGKRHIVVAKRRWDSYGRLQVLDADTHSWAVLDADGRGRK